MSDIVRHRPLPAERKSMTYKFEILTSKIDREGNSIIEPLKGYLTVGFYDEGNVGEIFIRMAKQGSEVSGFVDAWAIAVSMLLQRGVPLRVIVSKFKGCRFEPAGMTGNPKIPVAKSPVDYVCRILEQNYVDKERDGVQEKQTG